MFQLKHFPTEELEQVMRVNRVDVACITETWAVGDRPERDHQRAWLRYPP